MINFIVGLSVFFATDQSEYFGFASLSPSPDCSKKKKKKKKRKSLLVFLSNFPFTKIES